MSVIVPVSRSAPVTMLRVDWHDPRAVVLRSAMDAEMSALYAERMSASSPETAAAIDRALVLHPEEIVETVLVLDGESDGAVEVIGHAALRPFEDALEVKRVFISAAHRGRGIAKALLTEIESIARERGIGRLVLQTGVLQLEAIGLYRRFGYTEIAPFRGYEAVPESLCFEKAVPA